MSISNFVAQVAPMDHVAKVVQQEQESGLMKQQLLQHTLPEKLTKDGQQVAQVSAGESGRKLKRREERRGGQQFHGGDGSGREADDADLSGSEVTGLEEQLAELGIDSETGNNVWAGNIVNMKV